MQHFLGLSKNYYYKGKASQNFRNAWRKKLNRSFPETCASEMTLIMTDAAEHLLC